MKNRIIRISAFLLSALMLLSLIPFTCTAAEESANIFNLSEKSHMMVSVEYTSGAPMVKFISPDGTEYGADALANGSMLKEDDGSVLTYRIRNASAGQWKIVYDKGSNKKLNITWAPYGEAVSVSSLSYQKDSDTRLKVSLGVSYFEAASYNYVLYAVTTDENGYVEGKRQLAEGSGTANSTEEISVNISDLASYSDYKIMAEVSVKTGAVTVSDSKVSAGSFSYTNENAPEAMKDVYVEYGVNEEYLLVDWSEYTRSCESYILAIYENDSSEPAYISEFESDITSTEILIDPAVSNFKIDIGYKKSSGEISNFLSKTLYTKYAKAITTDAVEETSSSYVMISYDLTSFSKDVRVDVTVNENTQEVLLKDKGTMTAALELFENEFTVRWYLDETTAFVIHHSIYADNMAPLLILPEITTEVNTKDSKYILVGYTNPGCTVTVNKESAKVDKNGDFTITLNLKEGENEFVVISKNLLGISSSQTFTVSRSAFSAAVLNEKTDTQKTSPILKFLSEYRILLATLTASLLLFIHVIVSHKSFIKRRAEKGTLSAVLNLIGSTLIYISVLMGGYCAYSIYKFISSSRLLNSMEFYEAANKAVATSYAMIEAHEILKKRMILWIILFVLVLALAVFFIILSAFIKKKDKPKSVTKTKTVQKPDPDPKIKTEAKTNTENKTDTKPESDSKRESEAVHTDMSLQSEEKSVKNTVTFCPKCGTENSINSSFCKKCGAALKTKK